MNRPSMSPAWQYAKRAAARLFELGQVKREVSVGLMERVIWRAFCDGRGADAAGAPQGQTLATADVGEMEPPIAKLDAVREYGWAVDQGPTAMPRDRLAVHHLHHGVTACGFPDRRRLVLPRDWPGGHVWTASWSLVNCRDCLRSERAKLANPRPVLQAEPGPGTIETWPRTSLSSPTRKRRASATTSGTRSRTR